VVALVILLRLHLRDRLLQLPLVVGLDLVLLLLLVLVGLYPKENLKVKNKSFEEEVFCCVNVSNIINVTVRNYNYFQFHYTHRGYDYIPVP